MALVSVALCASCGGEVRGGEEPAPSPSGSAASGGSTSVDPSGAVQLPACVPGFLPAESAGRPCNFMVDDRCYETKVDACGCACPDKKGTICLSGLPVPNGRVLVTCE